MKLSLSKSRFLRGLQCHKALWLLTNRPDLASPPDKGLLMIFEQGERVGRLAHGLFPGGSEIAYERSRSNMADKTRELIASGATTIYEATFVYDDILVMVDILHKGSAGWELYEVKSGTGVKDVNLSDLSVQYYVLTGAGIDVSKASLVHINNKYVRCGEIDVKGFFTIAELTSEARARQDFVRDELEKMRASLDSGCPDINIGLHCDDPYECDYISHCWQDVPETSVFDIARLYKEKKFSLYYDGIVELKDIPADYPLNEKQRMQVDAEVTGCTFIDKEGIKGFIDTLDYPLYFLDFETFMQGIPPFDDTRPYQQIPFQFSLHAMKTESAELQHYEFLAEAGVDPREELIKSLLSLIPLDACVLAYNMSFEKRVISELADQFPQYKEGLLRINDNMKDLLVPFRSRYYYTKDMNGSASLKLVLPALLPELSYKEMSIGDGQMASVSYSTLHQIKDKTEVEQIRKNLLEYCKLDTLAMVKLLEKLRDLL